MGLPDVALLERLVGFDTVSRNSNLPLADFVAEYAEDAGAQVERIASPDGDKANLVLRFGPGRDDRSGLVLSGHMDTVPADEPDWESDPFALADRGDRLHARGACDMKGFLALALNVAAEARDLTAPLVLVFTYDEEVGTVGARHLAEEWPEAGSLPRFCLIGEPTELKVVRAHKGFVSLRVTLRGKSAHSGYPHLGRNAIEAAARVLVSLRKLRHTLETAGGPHADLFPEVPFVPLNVGTIHGGAAANVVPDLCVLELSARPLPGMNERGLIATIEQAVRNATGAAPVAIEVTATSPGLLLDPDAPIHTGLCGLTGQDEGLAVSYATDAGWLSRAGLECAILGPGSIGVAHRPNEYVPKQDLLDARRLLESAVGRFCR